MSKLPPVIRPYDSEIGLTGESAYLWALFLMNEADMNDDGLGYSTWKTLVDMLKPAKGKPITAAVYINDIEEALKTYGVC